MSKRIKPMNRRRKRLLTLAGANMLAWRSAQELLYTYPHERILWTKARFYSQKEPV